MSMKVSWPEEKETLTVTQQLYLIEVVIKEVPAQKTGQKLCCYIKMQSCTEHLVNLMHYVLIVIMTTDYSRGLGGQKAVYTLSAQTSHASIN